MGKEVVVVAVVGLLLGCGSVPARRDCLDGQLRIIGLNGKPVCVTPETLVRLIQRAKPMKTVEDLGSRIKANLARGGRWLAPWTADRLSGSGAYSKGGSVRGAFKSERAAHEAALHEARAWVDQYGQRT